MVNTKVFTIVWVEEKDGKKHLSFYGNMLSQEALACCQELILKEAQYNAVEEYKRGKVDGSNLPELQKS